MKQPLKNDIDLLDLVNKIQAQLTALDRKIDTLINRPVSQNPSSPKPPVNNANFVRHNPHDRERMTYKATCADCRKECTIPFKPTGDRPVYCQDCFSRRKVMRLSGMKVEEKPPQMNAQEAPVKIHKKKAAAAAKKAMAKKKPAPKKK